MSQNENRRDHRRRAARRNSYRWLAGVVFRAPLGWAGRLGSTAWARSKAWIWDFSARYSSIVFFSGFRFSPAMSRTVSIRKGSAESLKVPQRFDCRLNARADPGFVSRADAGACQADIKGSPGCEYVLRTSESDGNVPKFAVMVSAGGVGSLMTTVPADSLSEVGQNTLPFVATDNHLTAPPLVSAQVPTFTEWGVYLLIMLLVATGFGRVQR